MKLLSIKIENFTCFLKPIEFSFNNGLNIVNAGNGTGKSQLLNSIYWVLYNQIYEKPDWVEADNKTLYPVWYTNKNNEEEYKQDNIVTSVELILEAPHIEENPEINTQWYFSKKRHHLRSSSGTILTNRDELEIKYIHPNTGEHVLLSSYRKDDIIETLFPRAVRKLMWFQGEGFSSDIDLTRKGSGFNEILDKISHYPFYGKMLDRVKKAHSKKTKELNTIRSSQDDLSREQRDKLLLQKKLQEKVPIYSSQLEDIEEDIDTKERQLIDIEDYLNNVKDYVEINGEIKNIKNQISSINSEIETLEISKVNNLIKKWSIIGAQKEYEKFQSHIQLFQSELNDIDESKIPLHIPGPEMVQEMIDDMKCHICERDVPDTSDQAYFALLKRLDVYKEGQKAKWLRKNFDEFKRIKRRTSENYVEIEVDIKNHNKKINSFLKRRKVLMGQLEDQETKLDEITNGKKSTTDSSGSNYELYRRREKDKKKELDSLRLNKGRIEKLLQQDSQKLEEVSKDIKEFDNGSTELKSANKNIYYYELLKDIMHDLEEEAKTGLEKEITETSNYLFTSYYHNPSVIIEINNGEILRLDRSTGELELGSDNESQDTLIRFSIINALLKISSKKLGRSLPLIADAPTSSLEWVNVRYFTNNLGENFDQVILFSKDYLEPIKNDSARKTELINLCKSKGGKWYWIEQVDRNSNPVGPNNPKPKSESRTVIKEEI
ncbi:AAA family ATPase [Salegentibacter sp. F188]|uniref:AAA family ATPase n=1 Tax=Autumnicola patrickiae TaxID=3075591 RepID=A0ABU3DYE6_9FLAO|nr:AAA family ATPase [Salegentibacter sp. F188]MDT0688741.1 AAA family ATPase [Salegentibacter sp. F188]